MSKDVSKKDPFCPSSEVSTLRWFQNIGAGELVKKLGAGVGLTKK